MNRLFSEFDPLKSKLNLQIWILIFIMICIMQISESLADATVLQTITFWSIRIGMLVASLLFSKWLLFTVFEKRYTHPEWLKPLVLLIFLAAIPMTLIEIILESQLPMQADHDDTLTWDSAPGLAILGEYLTILSYLLSINLIIWLLLKWRDTNEHNIQEKPSMLAQPEFMHKAKHINFAEVIAIKAEGHYIRLHTQEDSTLIHYVFKKALHEIPVEHGSQIHRSWWVAHHAVNKAHKKGKRYQLILTDGLAIPVSDSYLKQVRELGLLSKKY